MSLIFGIEVDARLRWPVGRATQLAKKGRLPSKLLPDGSIRFDWNEIERLIEHCPMRDRLLDSVRQDLGSKAIIGSEVDGPHDGSEVTG